MSTTRTTSLGLLALGIAAAIPGHAQDVASVRTLEEIVVTATRREESAQTVPVSVNAFSSEMLEDRTVRQLGDLTRIASGIRFVHQGGGGNMNVTLRGLSRVPIGTAPNAVINYFADIPLNFTGSNIPTYDLGSIQVLKGPQGTPFGRNAMAGAVVITPQTPTYEFGGYVKGGVGNYDYNDVEGAVNIPLVDNVAALRLAAKVSRRDGYTENMNGFADQDDIDKNAYRATLLLDPTDTLTNTTVIDYLESDEAGTGSVLTEALPGGLVRLPQLSSFWNCSQPGPFNPNPCTTFTPSRDIDDALAQQQRWGPYKTTSEFDQRLDIEQFGVSNKTEWQLGPVTIRNIFGYRTTEVLTDLNTDGLAFAPIPVITASSRIREKQMSDEVHVFGKAFDDKLDYLVGAFWIEEEPDGLNGSVFPIASPVAPWVSAYTEKTNKAAFGQIGYQVLDSVKFNIGYRYNETEQEVCAYSRGGDTNININPEPPLGAGACQTQGSVVDSSENANTWNLGFDWQVNDNIFAYVTHRKGYREGGINAPLFNTPASSVLAPYQSYEPETLVDTEIGLKTDFMVADMPVRFNIGVYEGDYKNVVVSYNTSALVPATDPGSPLSSSLGINAGKRTHSGVETELVLQPTDSLTITNTASYFNMAIDEDATPPIAGLSPSSSGDASPQWATTLAVNWVLPYRPADGELVLNADYYWQETYFVGAAELPSYELANLRLDWNGIGGTGVDLGFFVRNLLDDDTAYAASATSASLGIYTLAYQEPRMYGLELKYSFGQ